MEPRINCFDWQNRSSDYLDGTLIGAAKKEADRHLDECPECMEHFRRYRKVLESISGLPRKSLPVPIRKAPLSFTLPKIDFNAHKSRWERVPWYIRTSVEGLGIAFAILIVVALVPRIRSLYERNIERRLDVFNSEELLADYATKDGAPMTRGKTATADANGDAGDEFQGENAVDGEEVQSNETEEAGTEVRVGNAEIWRFNLKTDSPREVRPKIVQLLLDAGVSKQTPGLGGIEAPGGIQFDLIVPRNAVSAVKPLLQKLANPSGIRKTVATAPFSETFTWYKNKSKKPVPAGKARLVIWLSQI